MKITDVIIQANSNLLRNKLRTFLTVLAIFIGSFTIILSTAINAGVNSFIDGQVNAFGGDGFISIASADTLETMTSQFGNRSGDPVEYDPGKNQTSATPITDEQIKELKSLSSIKANTITPMITAQISYITSSEIDKKFLLDLSVLPPGSINIDSVAGTKPNRTAERHEIMLPPNYATALGFESDEAIIGHKVTMATLDRFTQAYTHFEATVVGVQAPGIVTQNAGIINLSLGRAINDENTKYYPEEQRNMTFMLTAEFDYQNYTEQEVKDQLEEIGLAGMTVADIVGSIKTFFDIVLIVFSIFGGIALLAASIGIINTLFMSVQERTREIGLMKAMGLSSFKVFLSFSFEAISLGFWGSVLGISLSILAGTTANNIFHEPGMFLADFPTFNLVEFTIPNMIIITLIIMFIAFLAGTMPATRAARKNPIDALRYE